MDFVKKEITIFCPPGSLLNMVHGESLLETRQEEGDPKIAFDPLREAGKFDCFLLNLIYDEDGMPHHGLVEYKEGRKFMRRELVSFRGCTLSWKYRMGERIEEEVAQPRKKRKK